MADTQLARELDAGKRVVIVACDNGLKYIFLGRLLKLPSYKRGALDLQVALLDSLYMVLRKELPRA